MSSPTWRPLVPLTFGWGTRIERPAVYVDPDRAYCYIHGGRIPSQRQRLSAALLSVNLQALSDAPNPLHLQETTQRSVVKVIYPAHECRRATPGPSNALSAEGIDGPLLFDHILFRHDHYYVLHGGCDGSEVSNRVYTYHLDTGVWEDVQSVFGGCAVPRMRGHAVTRLSSNDGRYLICGTEYLPSGIVSPCLRKRLRCGSSAPVTGRPRTADLSDLRIYTVCMQDLQEGWRPVKVSGSSTPGPRTSFSLGTLQTPEEETAVFLVGGVTAKTAHADAWLFSIAKREWREVKIGTHPSGGARGMWKAAYLVQWVSQLVRQTALEGEGGERESRGLEAVVTGPSGATVVHTPPIKTGQRLAPTLTFFSHSEGTSASSLVRSLPVGRWAVLGCVQLSMEAGRMIWLLRLHHDGRIDGTPLSAQ